MDFKYSRLDKAIRRLYGKHIPQSIIEKAIRNKDILVNGEKTSSAAQISEEDNIYVHKSFKKYADNAEKPIKFDNNLFKSLIIYEDNNIIAINKPSGLAVQLGTNTEFSVDIMAKAYNPEARLVHRIDKETSGITLLAKNLKTSRYMLYIFKNKNIRKKYIAIVSDKNLLDEHGIINAPLFKAKDGVCVNKENGKEAVTEYHVLKRLRNNLALIEAFPKTGRTHQIRAHMRHIGCPILGDKKYGGRNYTALCLHAFSISFMDSDNKRINIKAALPEYIKLKYS